VYEIQGDTEAEYKVSDAQDFHGATFGKEVDDEPNVPEWIDSVVRAPFISVPISKNVVEVQESVMIEDHELPASIDEVVEFPIESDDLVEKDSLSDQQSVNSCPICMSDAETGASTCLVCGYSFK